MTPIVRVLQDQKKKSGFMKTLFNILEQFDQDFSDLESTCCCNYLYNTHIYSQDQADVLEQVFISFFGLQNLLNSQSGDLNSKYYPVYGEFEEYQDLGQDFCVKYYNDIDNSFSESQDEKVDDWLDYVLSMNEEFPPNLQVDYSLEYFEMVKSQATPGPSIHGHNLFVVVGSDVPRKSFFRIIALAAVCVFVSSPMLTTFVL